MATATPFRVPRCTELGEHITISDYAKWKSCLHFNLCQYNAYAPFLETGVTWSKASVPNLGLIDDNGTVAAEDRKTAVQKNAVLEQMLGLIAQYAPPFLRNDIVKKSTSMNGIWNRVRKHYGFQQSEVNFLNIYKIRREENERYETLYQRLVAHVDDNLLTADGNIQHDGAGVAADEELSPSCERLLVYIWLTLIDARLPAYVGRVYAHDLQTKSLKDIQPQVCMAMDSLLTELNTQEEVQVNYGRVSNSRRDDARGGKRWSSKKQAPPQNKPSEECILCKTAGRRNTNHSVNNCWFVSKYARALQISVASDDEHDDGDDSHDDNVVHMVSFEPSDDNVVDTSADAIVQSVHNDASVRRVSSGPSPYIFTFYNHHTCKMIIDTGATSSMVSASFVQRTQLEVRPAQQGARQLDKSKVNVTGECKFVVTFGHHELSVEALVTEHLDCDVLAGTPFGRENRVMVDLYEEIIYIRGEPFPYGTKLPAPSTPPGQQSHVLRNAAGKVVYPGEYLELQDSSMFPRDREICIEPRLDSPLNGSWPTPMISRVIQGMVRIPNHTNEPIFVPRSAHFAQVLRVSVPTPVASCTTPSPSHTFQPLITKHSISISVDPDNMLTPSEREAFKDLHLNYDNVFNKVFSTYNGASGPYKASIGLGPVEPPSTKPMLPHYSQSNMQLLQDEADKLESLGILVAPETLGITVKCCSPSFLRKKPDGTWRFVTAFNELGLYTNVPPTTGPTSNDILRQLSAFEYLIKSDLTKAFFQIPLDRKSIPYLGTVTLYKGMRVYTRSAMGQPGASEHLRELLTRIFGDYLREGFLIIKDDDMYVGSATPSDLLILWQKVLHRL